MIDLDTFLAHLNRPGATPAPKPDLARLAELVADTPRLLAADPNLLADLKAAEARSRRARGADLPEVA